jgi:hypothetical protein
MKILVKGIKEISQKRKLEIHDHEPESNNDTILKTALKMAFRNNELQIPCVL